VKYRGLQTITVAVTVYWLR